MIHAAEQWAKSRHLQRIVSGIEVVDSRRSLEVEQIALGQGFSLSTSAAEEISQLFAEPSTVSGGPLYTNVHPLGTARPPIRNRLSPGSNDL